MSYELAIHPLAEAEWARRDESVERRFKQKLAKAHLRTPRIAKDALHGLSDCCKIKIKITTPQFRLAYHVDDKPKRLTILAVSSRDDVYALLQERSN